MPIVRAALDSIDRNGAQGLTMRGLALDLGVEAMSLYRYVAGREDLLEAVVALLLEGLSDLDDQLGQTWQGYLQGLAHAVRRIAVEHPAAFPLVATRHPAAPWLRPPLRSLELVDDFLSTLSGFGFTDRQVVGTYRAFTGFLLGNLLLEAAVRGAETSPVEEPLDEGNAQVPNRDGRVDLSRQSCGGQVPAPVERGPKCRRVRGLPRDPARPSRDGPVPVTEIGMDHGRKPT